MNKTRLQAFGYAWSAAAPKHWWSRLLLATLAAAGHGAAPAHALPAPPPTELRAIDRVDEIRARLLAIDRANRLRDSTSGTPGAAAAAAASDEAPLVAQWANWADWQKWAKWNNWGKV